MMKALDVAAAQGARSFELRAAMSLARLRPEKRRSSAPLKELRRIHASFTEGLETNDLLEARALLGEGH
jgi:predicted ATPase